MTYHHNYLDETLLMMLHGVLTKPMKHTMLSFVSSTTCLCNAWYPCSLVYIAEGVSNRSLLATDARQLVVSLWMDVLKMSLDNICVPIYLYLYSHSLMMDETYFTSFSYVHEVLHNNISSKLLSGLTTNGSITSSQFLIMNMRILKH